MTALTPEILNHLRSNNVDVDLAFRTHIAFAIQADPTDRKVGQAVLTSYVRLAYAVERAHGPLTDEDQEVLKAAALDAASAELRARLD